MATDIADPHTANSAGDGKHLLVKAGEVYYRISRLGYMRMLYDARNSLSTDFKVDPKKYRMKAICKGPIPDVTTLSSSEALALSMGIPPDKADSATNAQKEAMEELPDGGTPNRYNAPTAAMLNGN